MMQTLRTAQIGRCGELLVQYLLLLRGIESAPMTTDSGIDLVAYAAKTAIPHTIQVKTNLKPKPGGGKGKLALDWWIEEDTPAQLIAFVDLSDQRVWLFKRDELAEVSQQNSGGRFHFYMYVEPSTKAKKSERRVHLHEFDSYSLEHRAHVIFGE
jgi:hypothetical protein